MSITLTNIVVPSSGATAGDVGAGTTPQFRIVVAGTDPDGHVISVPIAVNDTDAPHDSSSWISFWTDVVDAKFRTLGYEVGGSPPFNPWG